VDARLTAFEVENLTRAAKPRLAVVDETTHADVVEMLRAAGVQVILTTETGTAESAACGVRLDSDALMLFTSGSHRRPQRSGSYPSLAACPLGRVARPPPSRCLQTIPMHAADPFRPRPDLQ
jgi:hypothetical protein